MWRCALHVLSDKGFFPVGSFMAHSPHETGRTIVRGLTSPFASRGSCSRRRKQAFPPVASFRYRAPLPLSCCKCLTATFLQFHLSPPLVVVFFFLLDEKNRCFVFVDTPQQLHCPQSSNLSGFCFFFIFVFLALASRLPRAVAGLSTQPTGVRLCMVVSCVLSLAFVFGSPFVFQQMFLCLSLVCHGASISNLHGCRFLTLCGHAISFFCVSVSVLHALLRTRPTSQVSPM